MEKRLQNRKRCLVCKYYSRNRCPMFADADVGAIDKCILDYDAVKSIQPNSIEEFMFDNHPVVYLQWMGKGKSLEIGDNVLTLRGGFGSFYGGKFLTITGASDYEYFAKDGEYNYGINKDKWYMYVFKLDT